AERGIRLWDVVKGKELRAPKGELPWIGMPAFSPNRATFAVPDREGIRLVDIRSGKETCRLKGLARPCCQAFSADGTLLAVADGVSPNIIRLFDVASGEEVRQTCAAERAASALAFSPDGKMLAAWHAWCGGGPGDGGRGKCVLVLWDVITGKERVRLIEEAPVPKGRGLAFSPDGRTLASSGPNNSVCVWEVASGQERH